MKSVFNIMKISKKNITNLKDNKIEITKEEIENFHKALAIEWQIPYDLLFPTKDKVKYECNGS